MLPTRAYIIRNRIHHSSKFLNRYPRLLMSSSDENQKRNPPMFARPAHANEPSRIHARDTFPFASWDRIPTLPVVLTNVSLSLSTVVGAFGGLAVTLAFFLPLGVIKSLAALFRSARPAVALSEQKRVVIISGARCVL